MRHGLHPETSFVDVDIPSGMLLTLMRDTQWTQPEIKLFGREVPVPRLTCWVADPGIVYTYSGLRNAPQPWTAPLAALRERLQDAVGTPFNSVLMNLYRDGRDHMGWHADDEPELGPRPVIASVSLGATRTLRFRHRRLDTAPVAIDLPHNSVLVMRGDCQRDWKHCLPKRMRVDLPRINLTFRHIKHPRR